MSIKNKILPVFLFGLFCICLLGLSSGALAADKHVFKPISERDLQTVDYNGYLGMLDHNKGKVVFINVFGSWCPPCKEEVPHIINLRNRFAGEDFVFIGVSVMDSQEALVRFYNEKEMNYPVVMGARTFASEAGIGAVPQIIIYDRKGNKFQSYVGFQGEDELAEELEKAAQK